MFVILLLIRASSESTPTDPLKESEAAMFRSLFPSLGSRSARHSLARRRAALGHFSGDPSLVETLEQRVVLSGVTRQVADINPYGDSTPEEYTELVSGRTEGVSRERYLDSAHWRAELESAGQSGLLYFFAR